MPPDDHLDDHPDDHEEAARIATETGRLLLEIRRQLDEPGVDDLAVGDEGDRRAHEFILGELGRVRPDDAVLSEEGKDDRARLDAERVWIVDPVDGTREFRERGRTDWAVHVALVVGGAPVVGAVALPGLGITRATGDPPPAPQPTSAPPRVLVSRSRPPALAAGLAEHLGGTLVPFGSAGGKAMAIVRGEGDVYFHAGGQYEWDSAAPVAVALAAGCHASRIDGSPLRYNQPDTWLPDLLICRHDLANAVLDYLK
jgi:3'(2'), 5'-bisphosphate nucleotidase